MVSKTLDWLSQRKNKWYYYPFSIVVLPLLLVVSIATYPIRWYIARCIANAKNS